MNSALRIQSSVIAGACFIAVCLFILTIPSINTLTENLNLVVRLAVLVAPLSLFALTLVFHMRGYAELGRMNDSTLLTRSAQSIMAGFVFFELTVLASIFADVFLTELEVELSNTAVGLSITVLVIPAVLFAWAILRMYGRYGVATIAAASLTPAAVAFMWRPWPVAFVAAASVYLLYRAMSETR